jgi:ribosomal protein S18 acetylase RimI-like enzyme
VTAPLPLALLARIEDAVLNASAPPQQRLLDGWLLRHCPAKAKRARCVNPIGPGRLPLTERLALAQSFYAEVGLPLLIRITPFVPEGLDTALAELGLALQDDTIVMARPSLAELAPEPLPAGLQLQAVDADRYAEIVGQLRGTPAEQRRAHAQRLRESPVPYQGFVVRAGSSAITDTGSESPAAIEHGRVLACGQYAREDERVGLYDVFVDPAARGQGLARQLCSALLRQAREAGARIGYLQVEPENLAAQRVYGRLGFSEAYRYHYRVGS